MPEMPSRSRFIDDVRYIGSLDGRYVLSSRETRTDDAVKVFACRVKSITPHRAVIAAPVSGMKGEWATAQVGDLGLFKFQIEAMMDFGFSALISANDDERRKLALKIEYVKKRAQFSWPDQREFRRVTPRNPKARLVFADGRRLQCFLIDVSRSGAAISADTCPRIGLPIAIGKVLCRVVRHLEVGFAVQFLELQEEEGLEALLTHQI